jgi:hypothetical protein
VALAGEVDPRIGLVERDRDERIRLVVAQPDVEARLVLLDEVLLGQQRLGLAAHEQEVDRLGHLDHLHLAAGHAVGEVAGDPAADRLGLADVDDLARAVLEQIDARPVRQVASLLLEGITGPSPWPEDMATIPTSDTVRDLARERLGHEELRPGQLRPSSPRSAGATRCA